MREIKFRGRRLDNEEWASGSLISVDDTAFIIDKSDIDYNPDTDIYAFWFDNQECIVNPATVGQYWRTINGKKLFDGDIFRFKVGDEYIVRIVRYSEEKAAFCIVNPLLLKHEKWMEIEQTPNVSWWQKFVKDIEIIGNIHDNPELLKTE